MSVELADRVGDYIARGASEFVQGLNFRVEHAEPGDVTFSLPCHAGLVHGGGVICGQAILAGMDTGMVYVMASMLDVDDDTSFTTVQLQTSFERGVPADTDRLTFRAWATKPGRRLVFGQIDCTLPNGKRAATATTQYMWLPT